MLISVTEVRGSLHEDIQPAEHDAPHSPLVWLPPVPGADDAGLSSGLLGGHRGAAGLGKYLDTFNLWRKYLNEFMFLGGLVVGAVLLVALQGNVPHVVYWLWKVNTFFIKKIIDKLCSSAPALLALLILEQELLWLLHIHCPLSSPRKIRR